MTQLTLPGIPDNIGDGMAGTRSPNRGPGLRKRHPSIFDSGCQSCYDWYNEWIKQTSIVRSKMIAAQKRGEHLYDHTDNSSNS